MNTAIEVLAGVAVLINGRGHTVRLNERGYDADMRALATIRGVIVNTRHVSLTVDAVDLNNRLS